MAGKREGLRDQARVFDLCGTWAADPTAPRPDGWHDERSPLAAEPMRWAASLRPDLMAWEQVPPVLDLWSHCATLLGALGYSTWAGVISAERFGVPQTRKRAILLASRVSTVRPPHPTHQAYVAGEPARHDFTLSGEVLPWISMAEALGWNGTGPDVPAPTVTGGGTDAGGPEVFARGGRERIKAAVKMRANAQANAAERGADEPAPTIKGGNDSGDRVWVNGNRENAATRHESEPAPTVMFSERSNKVEWVENRPATTVAGDSRIAEPGRRGSPKDYDADGNFIGKRSMDNAVRVTVEEASILQSFDPAYPWQGSRSAQFQQIGNAVPPLLARAVLAALTEGHKVGSDCIDLFAGPGGWDVGARALGIDPLGIEYDDNACKTREAAGLRTLQGDVSALDPREVAAPMNPVRW